MNVIVVFSVEVPLTPKWNLLSSEIRTQIYTSTLSSSQRRAVLYILTFNSGFARIFSLLEQISFSELIVFQINDGTLFS